MVQGPLKSSQLKSRQKPEKFTTPEGVEVKTVYCRYCMESKSPKMFYPATDRYLDRNGYMSVCSDCVNEIYDKHFMAESDISRAIYQVCKLVNIAYIPRAVQATITYANKPDKQRKVEKIFSYYKRMMSSLDKMNMDKKMTFEPVQSEYLERPMDESVPESAELKKKWGSHLSFDDIEFLERELADWTAVYKHDTPVEMTLMKEICYKKLEIAKLRVKGDSTDGAIKVLQEIIKTSGLSPVQQSAASGGKSMESIGMWIKDVEQFEPAEWWNSKREKYVDINGWGKFAKDHLIRTIQNTLGLTKNFTLSDETVDNDQDMDFDAEIESDA
jgi:hypothetical protein